MAFFIWLLLATLSAGSTLQLDDRVSGALWGLFVGDALAMPVHWYYGGPEQIKKDFGAPISSYERAVHPFPDSIMQLSNTGGAGRGGDEGHVVGGAILHDKKPYWQRGGQFHYHHTLEPGENTLEASLVRVLMQSIVSTGGRFSANDFRERYISFMTTPGTHNDTYASTCHRMFFQKWMVGADPKDCPDNDGHNVDTIDGLVLPAVAALAALAGGHGREAATRAAEEALAVTRASEMLKDFVRVIAELLALLLEGSDLTEAAASVTQASYGSDLGQAVRSRGVRDPVVACYVGGSFPALLHFAYKYGPDSAKTALLASANAGGENVHRGEVLGLLLGAAQGRAGLEHLEEGLKHSAELADEIKNFVGSLMPPRAAEL